jgi:Leucine-rich repeat (LRR) protein
LGTLVNLEVLEIMGSPDGNHVADISPLSNLKDLVELRLWNNAISDASPLQDLPNLRTLWILNGNPLDERSLEVMEVLKSRGVEVH